MRTLRSIIHPPSTIIGLLFLTGCSSPKVWYQPGKTPADAARQLNDCREKAVKVITPPRSQPSYLGADSFNSGLLGGLMMRDRVDRSEERKQYLHDCMVSEGWVLVPAKTVPNGTAYPEED